MALTAVIRTFSVLNGITRSRKAFLHRKKKKLNCGQRSIFYDHLAEYGSCKDEHFFSGKLQHV